MTCLPPWCTGRSFGIVSACACTCTRLSHSWWYVERRVSTVERCAGAWRVVSEADSQALDPATEDRATDLLRRLLAKRLQLIQSLTDQHMRPLPALEPAGDGAHGVLMLPAPGELPRSSSAAAPFFPLAGLVSNAISDDVELVKGVGI